MRGTWEGKDFEGIIRVIIAYSTVCFFDTFHQCNVVDPISGDGEDNQLVKVGVLQFEQAVVFYPPVRVDDDEGRS